MLKVVLAAVTILLLLVVGRMVWLSSTARRPADLGHRDGRLSPCPRLPNCVSSRARGETHGIEPLQIPGPPGEALEHARLVIEAMPRARVVSTEEHYLHAEFRSLLFRFVDDLEMLWRAEDGVFDVRSASRVGTSDLGVNRRRVETLRRLLEDRPREAMEKAAP